MAIEAGSAYVTLIPSLRGFSARMRSGVNPAALAAGTAPTRPPTSACDEEDGMPAHQVNRFQTMAPTNPHNSTASDKVGSTPSSITNLPMVLATAVPPSSGPRNSNTPTMTTACVGAALAGAGVGDSCITL